MNTTVDFKALKKKNEELRYNLVAMMDYVSSGHPGGSLSVLEAMTTLYYGGLLNVDPADPKNPDRDRLVMSKGHASPTQYVIMADKGFFPKEKLKIFDNNNSMLPKHCNRKYTPGIDASTGCLGQGISMAVGMAMAGKMDKKDYKVYTILGDGECQSGEVWEAAMSAAKYNLDNLKAVLDNNHLQIDGASDDVMPLGDLKAKFEAFGWYVTTCNGHDLEAFYNAFQEINAVEGKPAIIIADTIKGNGVSFMEGDADWHSRKMTKAEGAQGLAEIAKAYADLGFGNVEDSILFLNKEELAELTGKAGE